MLLSGLGACVIYTDDFNVVLLLLFAIFIAPFVTVEFLLLNTWSVIRREGFSLANTLPGLFAEAVICWLVGLPLTIGISESKIITSEESLLFFRGMWFFSSFTALLAYSWFYRKLPRKRQFDYIIIHGAGLMGKEPTPVASRSN